MLRVGLRKNILTLGIKTVSMINLIITPPSRALKDYLRNNLKDLHETSFALLLTTSGNILTGYFMGAFSSKLAVIPSLLILIPGSIDMRGNIFGAFGSRLGSYLHLGQIEPYFRRTKLLDQNILSSFSLSFFMSLLLAFISSIFSRALGIAYSVVDLSLISILAGLISGAIMVVITILTAFITYRRGWNPDNLESPLITLFGDMFTLPFLFISADIIMRFSFTIRNIIFFIFIGLTVLFLLISLYSKPYSRRIIMESVPVFIFCGILSTTSGSILSTRIESLVQMAGLFTVIPAFLEDGGALGGILSANFSSWLHLGSIDPKFFLSRRVLTKFLNTHLVGIIPFSLIGILAYGLNILLDLPAPSLKSLFIVCLVAGEFLILVVNFLTFFLSVLTYRIKLNPDNVVIPLITSFMDIIGSFSLILFLILFDII